MGFESGEGQKKKIFTIKKRGWPLENSQKGYKLEFSDSGSPLTKKIGVASQVLLRNMCPYIVWKKKGIGSWRSPRP